MNLDKKIIKYKLKNDKITKKINNLVVKKKRENTKKIAKLFYKVPEINEIIEKITDDNLYIKLSESNYNKFGNCLFIIITGFRFVGKTTFIEFLEEHIGSSFTRTKLNINNQSELEILEKITNNTLNKYKIIYIETNNNFVSDIYNYINDGENIKIINIIPINENIYKNKIINKFFELVKKYNNSLNNDNFKIILNELDINFDENPTEILNILSSKIYLLDDDFNFFDRYIINKYENIQNYQFNFEYFDKILTFFI